ncbi:MAG: metallophosphoesterase [Caulobacteraceae bacterium]|nr:metallophosphoesterase [Caulobacteraceae bacterium]
MTAPNGLVWFLGALALGYLLILAGFARRTGRRRPRLTAALCILGLLPWAAGVWSVFIEPETLRVRHVTVESETWSGPPLRLGLISDSHVGAPHMDVVRLRRVIARMNAERPDIVLLLGDYAGGDLAAERRAPADREAVLAGVAAFRDLRSPLGTWAVLGNHDSWFDEVALARAFETAGIPLLQNRSVAVERPRGAFTLAGVADMRSRLLRTSVPEALSEAPEGRPVILMSHWPDPFAEVPQRVALTVAGHSHCGQIDLPLIGRPFSASPGAALWPCGAYRVAGRDLFVTGGLGTSVVPMRIGAPPEIVILTLKASPNPVAKSTNAGATQPPVSPN